MNKILILILCTFLEILEGTRCSGEECLQVDFNIRKQGKRKILIETI